MPPVNMSFLTEKVVRIAAPASRLAFAATAPRAFATSAVLRKTPTEAVKDGLKKVDRTVSDNVVLPGLDAAAKAKDTAQNMTKADAKAKATEMKGEAKGAAQETAGKVKGKAEEVKQKL